MDRAIKVKRARMWFWVAFALTGVWALVADVSSIPAHELARFGAAFIALPVVMLVMSIARTADTAKAAWISLAALLGFVATGAIFF
ncbi:MAG: hypothetical protein ABR507_10705 [Actinomycetota bacterium]|nr:hypothetical protein [Actinomycetota bacterium]